MADAKVHFQKVIDAGRPVGEIIAVNRFLVQVRGLQPVNIHSLVVFENGSKGFVQHILHDRVTVLHMGVNPLKVGMMASVMSSDLVTKVGKDFIGRIVSAAGDPLDGKGAIAGDANWPIFTPAPPLYERELLDVQLETGVTVLDTLFPILRGQRLALLGDTKSGKSTLATQIALNQRNTDQVVIYVMIAKRRSDIDALITRLTESQALDKVVVIVSTVFESLVMSYLAPYVGCAMAEYLWQVVGQDCVVIYDDLSAHAHAYREISLLAGTSPGRESYPGDMFHSHSMLLERAGRLKKNQKSLTAIPLVLADGGDITGFLPTNIMSITDGQWILDMDVFRQGTRPAVNVGLSVTRVGSRGQNDRQKKQNGDTFLALSQAAEAREFSQFGSDLELSAQKSIIRGRYLNELFTQSPGETYNLLTQQLMIDVVLGADPTTGLNVAGLKEAAVRATTLVKSEESYGQVLESLKKEVMLAQGGGG
ncbi:hypothetical protein A2884_02090 [Candidatus Saccharibacteria bacterium RIFCSPHIGHO2_01_FULL_48_12]|nr:MAG: hypothetical protein A2884_02090 [Candidatus Saccharibacteria bacterium RIFCSPHIGHO2_01_FULL_48_12]